MRNITHIIVHCTATPEGRKVTPAQIEEWHKQRGFKTIGYHYIVGLDGERWIGRPEAAVGAHAQGMNANSIGVCYVGGLTGDAKQPKDTRTATQKAVLRSLLVELKKKYPAARIIGHRDVPNSRKACPSFDAKAEYANI